VAEVRARDTVIEAVRAIEVADRVDHSGHVGEDGEPCGVSVSWKSRMGRDLAAALEGVAVPARDEVLEAVRGLVADWQANGNSRELGDPTAETWHKCARQLLRALDGAPDE
jgi:hypothetical protein